MSRLLIVSNRLPITVQQTADGLEVTRSAGGLATGLSGPHQKSDALWIGWPGPTEGLSPEERTAMDAKLDELRSVPVQIPPEIFEGFYEEFSNGFLWPLFHYLLGHIPQQAQGWEPYEKANELFADEVVRHYQPGDRIWVHDYHLMLLPRLLRERLPEARIGFFLHIPFPAAEIFRTVPNREKLLDGLLGADLVGFHTASYIRCFVNSLTRILGVSASIDRVVYGDREVRLGTFPMGIDVQKYIDLSERPTVDSLLREFRGDLASHVFVGIDRLDYTKGIRHRLLAYESLLRDRPDLHGKVRLVQVAVPSRTQVGAYQDFRQQVDASIGRINGAFGTPRWTPIHYLYRSLSEDELVALYRAADVMLVTPIRDGMNLVAKEFVAARTDDNGVLVLSEFAGAASELAEAMLVSPYDVERSAETFQRALEMSDSEKRARMRALRKRVISYDVHQWVRSYLETLESCGSETVAGLAMSKPEALDQVVQRMRSAKKLLLLLGYDGTLVPLANVPELSTPDPELMSLLAALAARQGTEIHLISGSGREMVDSRFGQLPIALHAEYGFWSRPESGSDWSCPELPEMSWRGLVLGMLETFTARTPGSLIEEKSVSLAWHYRMAEQEFGAFQANELNAHLQQFLSNEPVEILTDQRVIEVRPFGVNKGSAVASRLESLTPETLVVAMGDDKTDEELFAALPDGAVTIHVGSSPSRAEVRVPNIETARQLLASLLDGEPETQSHAAGGPS